jgi:hypothetical protein
LVGAGGGGGGGNCVLGHPPGGHSWYSCSPPSNYYWLWVCPRAGLLPSSTELCGSPRLLHDDTATISVCPGCAYKSVGPALAQAAEHDIVSVASGSYSDDTAYLVSSYNVTLQYDHPLLEASSHLLTPSPST